MRMQSVSKTNVEYNLLCVCYETKQTLAAVLTDVIYVYRWSVAGYECRIDVWCHATHMCC